MIIIEIIGLLFLVLGAVVFGAKHPMLPLEAETIKKSILLLPIAGRKALIKTLIKETIGCENDL